MSQSTWEIYSGATAPGGTTVPAAKNGIRAAMNHHLGAAAPSYAEAGLIWYDSTNDKLWYYDGSDWIELFFIDETNNKAYAKGNFQILEAPNAIGDWIAVTQTSYTDVDVSDDGVTAGASGVRVMVASKNVNTECDLSVRQNGSAETPVAQIIFEAAGPNRCDFFDVLLDTDGKFEAKLDVSGVSADTWAAYVIGFFW